jgi:hypothetical protein
LLPAWGPLQSADMGPHKLTGMGPDETDGLGSGCLAWTVAAVAFAAVVAFVLGVLLVFRVVPMPGPR